MEPTIALAFLGMSGSWEWLIILVIALLLFGRRLPEVMRGIGSGVREFRKGMDDGDDEHKGNQQHQQNLQGGASVERIEHQSTGAGSGQSADSGSTAGNGPQPATGVEQR